MPLTLSCPEEASASKPAQEGFWFLWAVLSVWPWRAFLSCFVLSCLFSPGGLLIPPHFPREIFWGGSKSSGCRGPEDYLPWPPELPAPPWLPELPAPPWSLSVCSTQSAHPPSPMELLRLGTSLSGGGVMSVLCRVCHVFPPLVSIFGLFPVLVSCHYELSMFQLCLSRYVLITLCILVLSFEFDFVWSTRYFPVYPVSESCLVLP